MASAPGPVVNPTWRLAGLSLAKDGNVQRRSTIGGERPSLKSPVMERPPPLKERDDENDEIFTSSQAGISDNSSEVTLIESAPKTPESSDHDPHNQNEMLLDRPEDKKDHEQQPRPRADSGLEMDSTFLAQPSPSPPTRPPPIPPRPLIGPQNNPHVSQGADSSWRQQAETAANQQDVTEVMENVLFKLECSIKPDVSVGESEPTNTIKE